MIQNSQSLFINKPQKYLPNENTVETIKFSFLRFPQIYLIWMLPVKSFDSIQSFLELHILVWTGQRLNLFLPHTGEYETEHKTVKYNQILCVCFVSSEAQPLNYKSSFQMNIYNTVCCPCTSVLCLVSRNSLFSAPVLLNKCQLTNVGACQSED